jgi:hypothetical protein
MDTFLTHLLAAFTAHILWEMVSRLARAIKTRKR